jgi:hypothetical protein
VKTTHPPCVEEALRAIGILFESGDVIEIRALHVGRTPDRIGATKCGYFNFESAGAIAGALQQLDGHAEGIYVVLNRLNPALLARANNRLQINLKNTTSDMDITERRWLYIDFDPVRPAGISATESEHQAALHRAGVVRDALAAAGWPEPVYADSGNGAHLLYRLPQMELSRAGNVVKACLKALALRYSDDAVKIDQSTSNASRICKLYGTLTRKGDTTPDRPHRRARIVDDPERLVPVPLAALEALAAEVTEPTKTASPPGKVSTNGFEIDRWIATTGLETLKGPEPYNGGRRWTLATCPFNPEHQRPVIIELANGALVYRCLHTSCSDRDWKALRSYIEPESLRGEYSTSLAQGAPSEPLIIDVNQVPSVWAFESKLDWCIEGMIARGSVTMICAESGTGKTWLAYYLAGCVARGVPVLGHAVKRAKVLYLDGENPVYVVKQRLFDLGVGETPDLKIWGGWLRWPPPGPSSPLVINFARRHSPLIIYDSLIEFNPGSEQSSTETRAFMRLLRALANLGATVLILHHTGKAETAKLYRGSSDIKAAVDTAYLLEKADEDSKEIAKISLTCFKGRLAPGQNFTMELRKGRGFVAVEHQSKSVTDIIAEILGSQPRSNQSEIIRLCQARGCGKGQIEKALKDGNWLTQPGPKRSILYSLSPGIATAKRGLL